MTITEAECERYARMLDAMQTAKSLAAEGDINRAMISAEKSRMLYRILEQSGAIETLIGESLVIEKVPAGFTQAIAAEAYLAVSEAALKEGNVKKAQLSHWMILPGTDLRQYLSDNLSKRAKRLDNLLSIVNRKYFN